MSYLQREYKEGLVRRFMISYLQRSSDVISYFSGGSDVYHDIAISSTVTSLT